MTKQKKPNKLLYKLRVLLSPSLWQRNGKINVIYDTWLWTMLENPCHVVKPSVDPFTGISTCVVEFVGQKIWIENSPYADGNLGYDPVLRCSRATALLFRERLKKLKDKQVEDMSNELLSETKGEHNA